MNKDVFSKNFQDIKQAVFNNDTEQTENLLKKYGLSNSRFEGVKTEYTAEYTFLLASIAGLDPKKLRTKTTKLVFDYATSAIEARRFIETINRVLCPEPSEQSETAPREIIESLHDINSRKDIQKKIEKLSQGELKSLVSHIVSRPDLKVSYELIRSIMRAILSNNSINHRTLILLIIPLSRTTVYLS